MTSPEPAPPKYNPYSAPGSDAVEADASSSWRAPGEPIKWIYAVGAAVSAICFFAIRFAADLELAQSTVDSLITVVDGPLRWGLLLIGVLWLHTAWGAIPLPFRTVTPGAATLYFLIPLYNLAWVFLVNIRLCDAIDRSLDEIGDRRRAPKSVALVAGAFHFMPMVLLLTAGGEYAFLLMIADTCLWFVYMVQCDELRRAVVAARMRE